MLFLKDLFMINIHINTELKVNASVSQKYKYK